MKTADVLSGQADGSERRVCKANVFRQHIRFICGNIILIILTRQLRHMELQC